MKKILVPCDFSDSAVHAFRFASEIASISKGEVFLLNIFEIPVLHASMVVPVRAYENAFLKELTAKANKNFVKMKDKLGKKVNVHLLVEQGNVTAAIKKFVDKKRIDLVVMGTHGASGFREFAIGSNTEKVVRSSKVPVIAVKKVTRVAMISNIVFPTNLNLENKNLVASLKELQSFYRAKLHILYVNTPANFTRDVAMEKKLGEFVHMNQFKNCTVNIYNDIDVESGIINFSSKFKNKMIAISTHGRKGLSHLFSGSIAENVVNHIDCPIWTCSQPI